MRILTNARHWKQEAFGLVEINYNEKKDLLRARLELITKSQQYAAALSNAPTKNGGIYIVVPTDSNCSTPEQIIEAAITTWKAVLDKSEESR